MRCQGLRRGAVWFRPLVVCALVLITVLQLSASGQADSISVFPLSLLGLPVEAMSGHATQAKTVDSMKGELGDATLIEPWLAAEGENALLAPLKTFEARVSNAVVFAELGGNADYEDTPLTLLSELLILRDFAEGKSPSAISLARVKDDFRGGDVCSDLGKNATCTMKGGFLSFYESTSPIPEPGTFLLVGSGVLGSSLPVLRGWRARLAATRDTRSSS